MYQSHTDLIQRACSYRDELYALREQVYGLDVKDFNFLACVVRDNLSLRRLRHVQFRGDIDAQQSNLIEWQAELELRAAMRERTRTN